MLTGQPFNIVHNGAQSGDETHEILARIQEDCLSHGPDIVLMQSPGINDLASNRTVEEIWTDLREIVRRITAAGIFLVCATITPCRTPETSRVGVQKGLRVIELNRRLRAYLQTIPNARCVDSYGVVVDVDDAEADADTNVLSTTDGVHYQVRGARLVAKKAQAVLADVVATNFDSRPRALLDSYGASDVTASSVTISDGVATFNSTAHGLLAGESVLIAGGTPDELNERVTILSASANAFTFATTASGTVTGTVTASASRQLFVNPILTTASGGATANGITGTAAGNIRCRNIIAANITAAASVVAHPDGFGNMQRLAIDAAATTDFPAIYTDSTSIFNGYLHAGSSYFAECDVRLTCADWASNALGHIGLRLAFVVDGSTYLSEATYIVSGVGAPITDEDLRLHMRTPVTPLPAGTLTAAYVAAYLNPLSGGSGIVSTVNFDVGRIGVWEVE
jgi:lysophospholipase L1-like esterase